MGSNTSKSKPASRDYSAPKTNVSFPGSNYASMGAKKKKDIGLYGLTATPMMEGNPGKGVMPSPFYKGAPKGVVGTVTQKSKKLLR